MSDKVFQFVGEGAEVTVVIKLPANVVRMHEIGNHFAVEYLVDQQLKKAREEILLMLNASLQK